MPEPETVPVVRVYADPDPARNGRIGYFCHVCNREEICPRYGLPASGFNLSALTPGAAPRLVWVCSRTCLVEHAATL